MPDRLSPPMPPEFQFPVDDRAAPSDEEAAFAKFLQEAPLILARERGLNARSLALLDAHARRLGLSSEDAAAAVRLLRPDSEPTAPAPPPANGTSTAPQTARAAKPAGVPTPPPPPPAQPVEEREFEAWLVCNVKRIPDGLFRPYLERRARAIAVERFRVDKSRLDEVLDRTLAAVGMKRFSPEEARRHLRGFLAQRLSQGDRIGRSDLEEFYRHGEAWGFSPTETDDELFSVRRSLHHADERDRSMGARYAALAIGAIVLTGGFLAALAFLPDFFPPGPTVSTDVPPEETEASTGTRAVSKSGMDELPAWWNAEAALAHSQLARERPGATWAKQALSPEPSSRAAAYAAMASELKSSETTPIVRQGLERLWQELILLEPDEKAAETLRRETFALLAPGAGDGASPGSPEEYTTSFAMLQTIGRGLSRFDAPPERAKSWKRALAAELKLSPERLEDADWLSACFAAVGGAWLQRLAESDLSLPQIAERRNVLERMLERFVASRGETDRLEGQFARDYLLRHPEHWETFRDSLNRATHSTSTEAVAALIDLMEGTTDTALQEEIASALRLRYDRPASEPTDELAANLRGALGIATDRDFERRRRLNAFRAEAAPEIAKDQFPFSTPKNAMIDLEKLTRLATQAYALESELRHPVFDELAKKERPEEAEGYEPASRPSDGPGVVEIAPEDLDQIRMHAIALQNAESLNVRERLDLLRRITRFAGDGSDVPYEVAEGIADYVAGTFVTKPESDAIATEMSKIVEWPTVTLALVDAMGVWPDGPPTEQRTAILQVYLGANWSPTEKDWKTAAIGALLDRASTRLNQMSGPGGGVPTDLVPLIDQTVKAIDLRREMISPADSSPAASIGEAYGALANAVAKSTEATVPDSKALAEAKPLLAAIERLASGDLQRAALYQRIVVRLEAERAAREAPDFAARSRELVDALAAADAQTTDVLQQLMLGERTIMLLALRGEDSK